MKKYLVTATWLVEANSSEEAINLIEDAVASKVGTAELEDSEADEEEDILDD